MRRRLVEFLDGADVLVKQQFGFRSGMGTSDAILEYLDFCRSSLDSGDSLVSVQLDFSRAFDTLDHGVLLAKLEHVGVGGPILAWLKSYLANRRQFVTVGSSSSGVRGLSTVFGVLIFKNVENFSHILNGRARSTCDFNWSTWSTTYVIVLANIFHSGQLGSFSV